MFVRLFLQVTNKDGNVVSNKAVLKVDKLGRAHRAAGTNPHDEVRHMHTPQAIVQLSSNACMCI